VVLIGRRSLIAYNGADSGLGNRVRVTLGARVLAEHENRALYYVWPTGKLFGPTFEDLWDFQGGTRIPRAVSRALERIYPYENADVSAPSPQVRARRVRQIRTGGELQLPPGLRSWREEFRDLTVNPAIGDRIRRVFDDELRGRPYVGVQIRAHAVSHQRTKEASPVSWFEERMRAIVAEHPNIAFFVSADVPEVLDRMKALFPHVVGLTDKGGYNTTEGVRSAVADLYLLASSHYILGSHYSSFLHLAGYLADGKVPIETSQHATPTHLQLPASPAVEDARIPSVRLHTES